MPAAHNHPYDRDLEPRYKRQRTAMACFSCRRRKTKCNGTRPACDICISMGFDCAYPKPLRSSYSSGNDPESMRRFEDRLEMIESLLQTVISQSGQTQIQSSTVTAAATTAQTLDSIPSTASPVASTQPNEATIEETIPDVVPVEGSPTGAELVADTVDGMGVITFADEFASGHFGPTSNPAFSNKISRALKEALNLNLDKQASAAVTIDREGPNYISRPPSPYAMVREKLTSPPRFETLNVFALPPRPVIIQLVDRFFSELGLLFPYISKVAITDEIENLNRPGGNGIRRSWLCLLNTVMAFATVQTTSQYQRDTDAEGDVFLQRALKLLPNVALQPANIEILQALLLLTQYLQGTQRSTQTYNFQGLTVRVAFQIGLHCAGGSSSNNTKESLLDREIKTRCWYMTFFLDKTCSMTFGRPPCIRNDYLQSKPMLDVDLDSLRTVNSSAQEVDSGPGPGQRESTVSCFSQSVKLYQIVGEIIDTIYQNNIPRDTSTATNSSLADLMQRVVALESQLENWKCNLPHSVRVRTKDEIVLDPPAPGSIDLSVSDPEFVQLKLSNVLTLRYLSARMLLHRSVLTHLLDEDVSSCSPSASDDDREKKCQSSVFLQSSTMISLDVSVSSAVEMIQIHHAMATSRHKMLTIWWFSVYYVFSAALVIFAAIIVQHRHRHRRIIQIDALQTQDMTGVLQNALDALELLGGESRMVSRCRKYLKKLMHGVMSLDTNQPDQSFQTQAGAGSGEGQGQGQYQQQLGGFDNFSMHLSEFSEVSPLGLDMGPFMAEIAWEDYM